MAIPPKDGHYTAEDFQLRIDQAIANMQWLTSQLAAMKAHPELAKNMFGELERPNQGLPGGPPSKPGQGLPEHPEPKDKAAYGMKK